VLRVLQAVSRFALPPILKKGWGNRISGFLDDLPHKGPIPVNVGPKVDRGSVRVATDQMCKKGSDSRVESGSELSPRSHCFAYGDRTERILGVLISRVN
jgi:hypothetical protein